MKKKDFYDYMKLREQKHLEEIIELKDRIQVLENVISDNGFKKYIEWLEKLDIEEATDHYINKYECKESL